MAGDRPGREPVRVVYLLGWFRSGSTLLCNLLGQVPGVFGAGEVRSLFANGVLLGRSCGCGQPLTGCPIWSAALAATLPATGREAAARRLVADQQQLRLRALPGLLRHRGQPAAIAPDAVRRYAGVLRTVYRTLADRTGSPVVVDSSKRPADAALLARLPDVDPFFVHLVRDPRAVARSEMKVKVQRDPRGPQAMPTRSLGTSVRGWLRTNAAADLIRARYPDRSVVLRYEDFAAAPRASVEHLLGRLGLPDALPFFAGADQAQLSATHTVAGNADRFRTGLVHIRADDDWRTELPAASARIATAATWPLLARYGYPIRGQRER